MARRRTPQDPQYLRDLKAGQDRDGRTRTWHEVAEIAGVSAPYARRVGQGRMAHQPDVVRIDPREIVTQFTGILSDEDVQRWNEIPYCLCGCGQNTLQECGNKGKVPYGAYRLFRGAHEKRMPWVRIRLGDLNREKQRRRLIGLARRAQSVPTGMIADLLNEWKAADSNRTIGALAKTAHLSASHVRDIAIERHERISKLTTGKLFAAIGEPMSPEIFAEYRTWAKANQVPYKHIEVIKWLP